VACTLPVLSWLCRYCSPALDRNCAASLRRQTTPALRACVLIRVWHTPFTFHQPRCLSQHHRMHAGCGRSVAPPATAAAGRQLAERLRRRPLQDARRAPQADRAPPPLPLRRPPLPGTPSRRRPGSRASPQLGRCRYRNCCGNHIGGR